LTILTAQQASGVSTLKLKRPPRRSPRSSVPQTWARQRGRRKPGRPRLSRDGTKRTSGDHLYDLQIFSGLGRKAGTPIEPQGQYQRRAEVGAPFLRSSEEHLRGPPFGASSDLGRKRRNARAPRLVYRHEILE